MGAGGRGFEPITSWRGTLSCDLHAADSKYFTNTYEEIY